MTVDAIIVYCWIALALTAVAAVVGVAVGAAYHPETGLRNLSLLAAAVVFVASLLIVSRRVDGISFVLWSVLSAVVGVALVGSFGILILSDPGDALLYVPPAVLGLLLLALIVGISFSPGNRGDA